MTKTVKLMAAITSAVLIFTILATTGAVADWSTHPTFDCLPGGDRCRNKSDCGTNKFEQYCTVTKAPKQCSGPALTTCKSYYYNGNPGVENLHSCGWQMWCADDSEVLDGNGNAVQCTTVYSLCERDVQQPPPTGP